MKTFNYLFLLFSIFTSSLSAQTKDETENWILQQTYKFPGRITYSIQNGNIQSYWPVDNSAMKTSLPIKSIKEISFVENEAALTIILSCNNNCGKSLYESSDAKYNKSDVTDAIILVFPNANGLGLAPRLQKSFLHLIKLYGGKAIAIQPKKEPF